MTSFRAFQEVKNDTGNIVQLKSTIASGSDLSNAQSVRIKTEQDISPESCHHCGNLFNRKNDLLTHVAKVHTECTFQCEICDSVLISKELFDVHMKLHAHSGKCFQQVLDTCSDSSGHRSPSVDITWAPHEREKKCLRILNVKSAVEMDIVEKPAEQNSLACNICGKHFKRLYHLNKHNKIHNILNVEAHDSEAIMSGSDSEEESCNEEECNREGGTASERKKKIKKAYQCEICGKNFALKDSYKSHQRIHTGEKPFTCHICGKQFSHTGGLYYHLKHVHAGIKNHSCDICGRSFALKAAMEDHRRIHTGERPYVCHTCGKPFKTKASLYIHSKIHTDSFPHPCTYCERRFRWKQQLLAHVTTHTGEKPHTCDVCGKGFGVKNDLTRHKLIHSDEKPFICSLCGLCFGQKRYLKNHEKSRHGMQR